MAVYYFFYLIPAFLFISAPKSKGSYTSYFFVSIVAVFFIGYREYTGGDWWNYYNQFIQIGSTTLWEYALSASRYSNEIFFNGILWIGHEYADFYLISSLFATISFYALYRFAKAQPYFWLTITLAIPFFVIIMVMGYVRQGLALSFLMIGLTELAKGKPVHYLIWVAFAVGFHNSAIVFVLLAIPYFLSIGKYRAIGLMIIFPAALFGAGAFESYFSSKIQHYVVDAGYEGSYLSSSGALIRILINAAAGLAFFIYINKWKRVFQSDYFSWYLLSFASLISIPLLFLTSSTSADRMALYLLVLQLAVWPRIIYLSHPKNRQFLMLGLIAVYGVILSFWLNFADNVWMWLPYRHHILGEL